MTYWEKAGKVNTQATVDLAIKRAEELGLEHIVVASNTGATAEKFVGRGLNIVCVTHHVGFTGPGEDEMRPEVRRRLEEQGVKLLTTT
ncbi:MAG: hypothetical protein DRI26_05520, partial [Chloroflexi bacterium]